MEQIAGMMGMPISGQLLEPDDDAGIASILDRAGIDASASAGLDQAQTIALLAQHGMDASVLDTVDFGQGGGLFTVGGYLGRSGGR